MKWISVEDRLPEKEGRYFTYKNGVAKVSTFYPNPFGGVFNFHQSTIDSDGISSIISFDEPTHWAEIKPPKTEDHDTRETKV